MLRSQVREEIFKILFRLPFIADEELEEQTAFAMEELQGKSQENQDYIREKVAAIRNHVEELDDRIKENCEGWSLNRIGKAEIAIMRIAAYEMLYEEDVPESVAINEAIELTKLYCDEDAKGFVNAVLGKIAKQLS